MESASHWRSTSGCWRQNDGIRRHGSSRSEDNLLLRVGCGVLLRRRGRQRCRPRRPNRLIAANCVQGSALRKHCGRLLHRIGSKPPVGRCARFVANTFDTIAGMGGLGRLPFQFLTEDYYVANKLMKVHRLGKHRPTRGSAWPLRSRPPARSEDVVAGIYDDFSAPTWWCRPAHRIATRSSISGAGPTCERGTRIVVIDPDRDRRGVRLASGGRSGTCCSSTSSCYLVRSVTSIASSSHGCVRVRGRRNIADADASPRALPRAAVSMPPRCGASSISSPRQTEP